MHDDVITTALVKEVWDPVSMAQTQRLVQLLRQLAEDYPTVNAESTSTQVRPLPVPIPNHKLPDLSLRHAHVL